ncbi:hypothetical protein BCR43DRAFT_361632 [Syncephalastrum racemosum]|uniref:Uncharacterized protein n=1 Tax=Syncephalastrum racemosum TaxID=13706 RepID=A0A1X2H3N3_SYNRA|nr:hypothetical protein BCR43DRAFT_361632 [Syncephalastrum racemosum]
MFSRFDNMMQHTQTHNKSRNTRRAKGTQKKGGSSNNSQYSGSFPPSPPPSRRSSMQSDLAGVASGSNSYKRYARPAVSDEDEDDDEDMYDEDSDASYQPPDDKKDLLPMMENPPRRANAREQREMMAQLRRISREEGQHHLQMQQQQQQQYQQPMMHPYYASMPMYPWSAMPQQQTSPYIATGSDASPPNTEEYLPHPSTQYEHYRRRSSSNRHTPQVHFHPYQRRHSHAVPLHGEEDRLTPPLSARRHSDDYLAGRMILPRLASYLVNNPDAPAESYLRHVESEEKENEQEQTVGDAPSMTRRLSVQELCNPIESLQQQQEGEIDEGAKVEPQQDSHPAAAGAAGAGGQDSQSIKIEEQDEQEGVDLTQAEYEALQGLGRFRSVKS